ncbi:MAG: hypothetical protein ACKO0M_14840, partial [Cyanobium sp.]
MTPPPPGRSRLWLTLAGLALVLCVAAAAVQGLPSPAPIHGAGLPLMPMVSTGLSPLSATAMVVPAGLSLLLALLLDWIPRRTWSAVVAQVLLVLVCLHYLFWRTQTLDQGTSLALVTGAVLLLFEALHLLLLGLWLAPAPLFDPGRRRRQADQLQASPGGHSPSVEFWVRSDDQEERIVRRSLIACRNVDHPDVQVAVLDARGRDVVRRLAEELDIRYVALPPECRNGEAYEPLLRAALPGCRTDLVAPFDSRTMPFAVFLKRTLGFLDDARVAMVQTPLTHFDSEFYNRNLGADQVMPGERDLFFHYGEVVLDRFNSVQACDGSSLIRRSSLEAILAHPAESSRESTAVAALQREGERVVYLDEILSIGEAPHTFAAFLDQQLAQRRDQIAIIRAGGTLPQGHPLSPWPLLYQIGRVLALSTPFLRMAFLLIPLFALLMGVPLIRADLRGYLIHGLPMLVLLHTIPSWLTDRHHSRFWGEVSEALTAVPSISMLFGRRRRLQDRPRGVDSAEEPTVVLQSINLNMAWPFMLILVELMTVLFLRYILPLIPGFQSLQGAGYTGESLTLLWNLHNGLVMIVCLICAIDQPVRRQG